MGLSTAEMSMYLSLRKKHDSCRVEACCVSVLFECWRILQGHGPGPGMMGYGGHGHEKHGKKWKKQQKKWRKKGHKHHW